MPTPFQKLLLGLVTAMLVSVPTNASAVETTLPSADSGRVIRRCSLTNGRVSTCGGWDQGSATLRRNGAYRRCAVVNGRATTCGPWHQGSVVAFRDGAYRTCSVVNGQITVCGGWHQGSAVLERDK